MPDLLTDARKVLEALERMDRKGGLGLDVHDWISDALTLQRRFVAAEWRWVLEQHWKDKIPLYAHPPLGVSVPEEPTDRMCVNGAAMLQKWVTSDRVNDLDAASEIYRAMLAARPK